jgi:hypothetical protein
MEYFKTRNLVFIKNKIIIKLNKLLLPFISLLLRLFQPKVIVRDFLIFILNLALITQ